MKLSELKQGMLCIDRCGKKFLIKDKSHAVMVTRDLDINDDFILRQFYDEDMLAFDRDEDFMDVMIVRNEHGSQLFKREE